MTAKQPYPEEFKIEAVKQITERGHRVDMKFPSSFAYLLRDRRCALRLRLKTVAINAGLSISYLQQMEVGKKPAPPQTVVDRLAIALHLSDEELVLMTRAAEAARRRAQLELGGASDQAIEVLEKLLASLDRLSDHQLKVLDVVLDPSQEVRTVTR